MKHTGLTLPVLAALVAAGCASGSGPGSAQGENLSLTLNRSQCATANWRAVGVTDGRNGKEQPARVEELDRLCGRHNEPVDREAYAAGYEIGASGG